MEAKLALIVVESCVKLMSPVDAAPIDDHDDIFAGFAECGHHLVDILAQLLGIKVGNDFRADFGRAILHCSNDTEQHAAGDATPRAIADPCLALEALFTFDLTLGHRARGEAVAQGGAPPARPGQGKPPEDGFVFIE